MELYLIRHGQSTNNRGDSRVADPPLTELAEEQARRAGESIKNEGITRLYCSPMLRALHTATIIGDSLGLAPHVFVGLDEMGGIFEERELEGRVFLPGLNRSEMREVCPNVILPDDVTDDGWWFSEWEESGEPGQMSYENGLAFIEHLKANHLGSDERIAAVSHGGSGSKFLEALFGLPNIGYTRFAQHNTAVSKIVMTEERIQLRYLNRTDHLPKGDIT